MKIFKRVLLILIGLIILGGASFYVWEANKPRNLDAQEESQALKTILGRSVRDGKDIKTGNVNYQGKYMSFSYPAQAQIYTLDASQSADAVNRVEYFSFDLYQPRLVFNAFVAKNTTGLKKLDELSGVIFRRSGSYKERRVAVGDVTGLVFSKDDPSDGEETAFFLSGGFIYTLSATGGALDNIGPVFDGIITSLTLNP